MPNITTKQTEADLETQIDAAMRRVFPWITDLRHQTRFEVTFGRNRFTIDGSRESMQGRSDIIPYRGDAPLAVLELKRADIPLTADDDAQVRSYALLLGAPIVVVTNGSACRVLAAHDMRLLSDGECSEKRLSEALSAASRAAKANLANAVATLLGDDDRTWKQAVSAVSAAEIRELSGGWRDRQQRFVDDFLVPRNVTRQVLDALGNSRSRAAIVTGPPLSGKSSVLREFVEQASGPQGIDVLYVDCASTYEGLFRRLANILAAELDWPATPEDARNWLRRISQRQGGGLVVVLDAPPASNTVLRQEVDELLSRGFGEQVKLVVALDENHVATWTKSESGRDSTRLGRLSTAFTLELLDDGEFAAARALLRQLGGEFVEGADKADEFRAPWILRSVAAKALDGRPPELLSVLPPLLGIDIFSHVQGQLADQEEIREPLARLARAYLDSLKKGRRSAIRVLTSMYVFAITEQEARKAMDKGDIQTLVRTGIIRRWVDADGCPSLAVRQPELFAYCVAFALGQRLAKAIAGNRENVSKALTNCASMPLGDLIGAQAILFAAQRSEGHLPLSLLNELLQRPPRRVPLSAGLDARIFVPELGLLTLRVDDDGRAIVARAGGPAQTLILNASELGSTIGEMEPWLILARLCSCRFLVGDDEGQFLDAMPTLLLELASAPVIMRGHPGPNESLHVHDIEGYGEVACFHNGIVEPITMSIATWLSRDDQQGGGDRDDWIDEALSWDSLPLTNRIYAALRHLRNVRGVAEWAQLTLDNKVRPAIDTYRLH
ncbi:AAA family ATPase [Ralstonia pseudosolanacearum]|uniref:AAA family ATPase n=1 Tax=Ralstonia pseudosolanacearum TaxID=1310165 RepID=UPI003AAFD493